MVYILTNSDYDLSTNEVINWLIFNKIKHKRLNVNQFQNKENLKLYLTSTEKDIIFNGDKLNFENKCLIWYRRIGINRDDFTHKISLDSFNFYKYLNFRNAEWNAFIKIFLSLFPKNTIWFDDPLNKISKVEVLISAKKNGLTIPNFVITNSLENINFKNYITKPLTEATNFSNNSFLFTMYTKKIKKIKGQFLPSLFQENIIKKYEIRSFFIDNTFFSMAIFSQNDSKTSVDFRNYNFIKPNRTIPYKLPIEIEKKLIKLMHDLKLKNGSIDIIKGIDNEYYFLEVNPVGQFGMVSKPCNYNIENFISKKLNEKLNENN